MRLSFQPGVPDSLKELVLELEQAVLDGRIPDQSTLEALPEQAVCGSPLLLRTGSVHLMLEGQLKEAQEWLQAAIRGFALQANHVEMLSMIALLTLVYVRIGDFTETETLLHHLEEESLRSPDNCSGFVWWALARGRCWGRTSTILGSLTSDEYFARAADWFREEGASEWYAYLLLDRWLYDPESMRNDRWNRRIVALRQWGAIKLDCEIVLKVLEGRRLSAEEQSKLPSRFGYLLKALHLGGDEASADPPVSDLRYDVEAQLFTSRVNVRRKLAAGDRTSASVALRQMELMLEEMSTPRTQAWHDELREKIGANVEYAPLVASLPVLLDEEIPMPAAKQNRLRVQLMSGIRFYLSDGTSVSPKWKRRKSRELLVYLLLQPEYRVLRDQVVEQVFGEGDATKLANHLYVSLHELRNALASIGFEEAIEVRGGLIGFKDTVIEAVDVEQFTTLSRVGDQLWGKDKEASVMLYMDAVRLYGTLGSDMPYLDWLERWRSHMLERQTQMLRRLGDYYASLEEDSHTEQWLSAWIDLRPDQEEAYQAMIRYWKERGRHAEAVSWYRRLERVCREELGTVPLEETRKLVWEA
jgi:DNA-binding SARP family transcriptional activator